MLALSACCLQAQIALTGSVSSENSAPIAGARVMLRSSGGLLVEAVSGAAGLFTCSIPDPGTYSLSAERTGYFRLPERELRVAPDMGELHLVLTPVREVYESIDVTAAPQALDMATAAPRKILSGAQAIAIPFPSSNSLKNALRVMPGVVQDSRAGIHLNGGAEDQILFTLDGFTVNDPYTGRFDTRVGVEAIQSMEIVDGQLPAEFGKGAAGMVAISTTSGDDRIRPSLTNFFPGIETANGIFIGNWSPRFSLSGPIRKGRAWFSDSIATQYDQEYLPDMPGKDTRLSSWRLSNLLHTQVNLTRSQILQAALLINGWSAPHTGLNPLTPLESTVDRRTRQWFFSLKDQIFTGGGALLEIGFAANRTYARDAPQGRGIYRITPDGTSGNFYADESREAGRDQWLATYSPRSFQLAGEHRIRTGIDVSRLEYRQSDVRTGFEQLRPDGTLAMRVVFAGPAELSRPDLQTSYFVQDAWKWKKTVLLDMGVRADWDRVLHGWNVAPRVGVAWLPPGLHSTRLYAAYAVVYEGANLRLFTRPLDQYRLTTYYDADGIGSSGPVASIFVIGPGRPLSPRARNWSMGIERQLAHDLDLRMGYLRRRGDRGFTYRNQIAPGDPNFDNVYRLVNDRRDVFDSMEVTMRQTLRRQYGWMASYTRSRATSNAVLDVNLNDPTMVLNNEGPMPWDSPNRFVGWAYLPLPWKDWAVASMLETRTGFPFSAQGAGLVIGEVNSLRFPPYFELNLHGERRQVLMGHRWELRAGFNNITAHRNYTVVNANAESRNYLQFYGAQGRTVSFRIRWLGKVSR